MKDKCPNKKLSKELEQTFLQSKYIDDQIGHEKRCLILSVVGKMEIVRYHLTSTKKKSSVDKDVQEVKYFVHYW
jgi:hypothetical protein